MGDSGQKAIGIRGKIYACGDGLEIEDGSNERRVLMREPVVLLPRPCRRLKIVNGSYILPPRRLSSHLYKLGVLYHHCVHNTQEGFVTWEETSSSGECESLDHTLTGVLGQDLDDSTAACSGSNVPLEITTTIFENGIKLIGDELIWREYPEGGRILVDNLLQKPSDGLYATFLRSFLYGKVTPFRRSSDTYAL